MAQDISVRGYSTSRCGGCGELLGESSVLALDIEGITCLAHCRCGVEMLDKAYHSLQKELDPDDAEALEDMRELEAMMVSIKEWAAKANRVVKRSKAKKEPSTVVKEPEPQEVPEKQQLVSVPPGQEICTKDLEWVASRAVIGAALVHRYSGIYTLYPPTCWPYGVVDDRQNTHFRVVFSPVRKGGTLLTFVTESRDAAEDWVYDTDKRIAVELFAKYFEIYDVEEEA